MAIQNRRGVYTDFDESKMVAGEIAVVQSGDPSNTDGKAIYIAFQNGSVARLVLADEMGTLSDLETTVKTSVVDAINELAGRSDILYGSTITAGSTRDKIVTCEDFEAVDGTLIIVLFNQSNTATNARLNVNGTGACDIVRRGTTNTSWLAEAPALYLFRYTKSGSYGQYKLVGAIDVQASNDAPKMNGTTSAGTSDKYSRGDHVHPSDTTKVDKIVGKGLSTEDYTTAEKTKLSGIEEQATKTVIDATLANAGQAADAKKVGDELTDLKDDLFPKLDISFPVGMIKALTATSTAGNVIDATKTSSIIGVTLPETVVITADEGYHFSCYITSLETGLTKKVIPASTKFNIAFSHVSADEPPVNHLDFTQHLHLHCSPLVRDYINKNYVYTLNDDTMFVTPTSVYAYPIARGGFNEDLGVPARVPSYYRVTTTVIAPKPFVIQTGYYTTNNVRVNVFKYNDDGTITKTNIPQRTKASFEAGTYVFLIYSGNTSQTTGIVGYVLFHVVDEGLTPTSFMSQLTTAVTGGCRSAFKDDKNNVWYLHDGTQDTATVRLPDFTTVDVSFGTAFGHANTSTYLNGVVWVSDWNNEIIRRYNIDSTNLTATFIDAITMPEVEGSVNYCPISETEIIGVVRKSTTDPVDIVRYIYNKSTQLYEESSSFSITPAETIMQGIYYYNGFLYILYDIASGNNYVNKYVTVVNMASQNYIDIPITTTYESESIISVDEAFFPNASVGNEEKIVLVIVYQQGQEYRCAFDRVLLPV